MSAWRTIDSAPRDGTRVLLGSPLLVAIGHWPQEEVSRGHEDGYGFQWMILECDDAWYNITFEGATKWQPLPEPPA